MGALTSVGISKKYGKKNVLNNIDLTLEKGKIYGLIGRNGAGKTTLLSIMSAQNPTTTGTVELNGEAIWEKQHALGNICFSREIQIGANGSGVSSMKVKEYLQTASWYYPHWDKVMADKLVKKFKLDPKKKLADLSKGMLSMVTIIIALASKANYTFLDEPVAGLDVVMREYFYRLLIEEYSKTGRTFVVSTHIIEEAADVFEEIIMIKNGTLLLKENTESLVSRAYRISGLAEEVDAATKGLTVHHVEKNGRGKSVTVLLAEGEEIDSDYDVTVQSLNLQNVFVALCGMEDEVEKEEE